MAERETESRAAAAGGDNWVKARNGHGSELLSDDEAVAEVCGVSYVLRIEQAGGLEASELESDSRRERRTIPIGSGCGRDDGTTSCWMTANGQVRAEHAADRDGRDVAARYVDIRVDHLLGDSDGAKADAGDVALSSDDAVRNVARQYAWVGCNRSDPINGVVKLPLRFGAEPELGGVRPTGLVKRGSLAQMEVYQSRPRERTPPCPNLPHPAGPSQARLPMIWLSGWVAA